MQTRKLGYLILCSADTVKSTGFVSFTRNQTWSCVESGRGPGLSQAKEGLYLLPGLIVVHQNDLYCHHPLRKRAK